METNETTIQKLYRAMANDVTTMYEIAVKTLHEADEMYQDALRGGGCGDPCCCGSNDESLGQANGKAWTVQAFLQLSDKDFQEFQKTLKLKTSF